MTAINPVSPDSDERPLRQRRPTVRWRLLLATAVLVPLIGYFGIAAVIAAVTVTADGARDSLGTALLAALPGWLAAFQVPLSIGRAPLSALPLLPTVGIALLIARASARVVRRSRVRRPEQALWVILTMAFAHAVIGTALALVIARLPGPVEVVPGDAFAGCGLVAAAASTLGVVHRCGLLYLLWERVPGTLWWGLNCGFRAAAAIAGAGVLVLVGALCSSVPELVERSAEAGSPGAAFGGAVLSVLYLPDAVLAAWSYTAGTGISFGELAFSPFGAVPESRALPALPLFDLLPDAELSAWWSSLSALPVAVGVYLGWSCREADESPRRRLWAAVTASLVTAVLVLAAGVVVGGHVGGGRLDPMSVRPLLLAAATWGWLAFPAGVTAWLAGPHVAPGVRRRAEPEDVDEALPFEEAEDAEDARAEEPEGDSGTDTFEDNPPESAGEAAEVEDDADTFTDDLTSLEGDLDGADEHDRPGADAAGDERETSRDAARRGRGSTDGQAE